MALMKLPRFKPFFERAVALKPPSLQCFPGNEKGDQLLAHMFIEMGQAAVHEGYTHSVFERLTWIPSREVEAIVTPPREFNQNAGRVLRDTSCFPLLFSWGHLRAKQEEDMDDQSIPPEQRTALNF